MRVFGRTPSFPTEVAAAGNRIDFSFGDVRDPQSLANAVKGCDHMYHLVATTVPATSNGNMVFDADSNLLAISNCYGPRLPIKGEQGVVGVVLDRLRRGEPITLWGDGSVTTGASSIGSPEIRCGLPDASSQPLLPWWVLSCLLYSLHV